MESTNNKIVTMSFMVISYTKGYILGFNVQNSERSHSAGPRTGRGLTSNNTPPLFYFTAGCGQLSQQLKQAQSDGGCYSRGIPIQATSFLSRDHGNVASRLLLKTVHSSEKFRT